MVEGVECSQKERSCIDGDGRMSAELSGRRASLGTSNSPIRYLPSSRRNVQHWIQFCCSPVISVLFYKVARLFHSALPFPCVWSQQLGHSITAWYLYIVWLGCANSRPILSPLPTTTTTTKMSGDSNIGAWVQFAKLTEAAGETAPFPYIKSVAGCIVTILEIIEVPAVKRCCMILSGV